MHKDKCIDAVLFRCFCRCILPAPRELKHLDSYLQISSKHRCILPAPRELKRAMVQTNLENIRMYLTRAAGIETISYCRMIKINGMYLTRVAGIETKTISDA